MIRRRIVFELHGRNVASSLRDGLRHAMHAIHHPSTSRQDDREREVGVLNQREVAKERPPGRRLALAGPPFIELANLSQRNACARQAARQMNQMIHIPRQDAAIRVLKVILLAHGE